MTTYPLPSLAAQIVYTGIVAPSFQDVLASLQATYRGIYGADAYLDPDSQDGQLLASFASIINDCNSACIAVYNSFSPTTAIGAGLSSNVKLNGLKRRPATPSTVDVHVIGQAGTQVFSGTVIDPFSNLWRLPALVTIPPAGTIIASAYALEPGALSLASGTNLSIVNPTLGWQKAVTASDASPGVPVETDAELRIRQSQSTNLPAQTPLESIVAELRALPGVTEVKAYENDTDATWVGDPTTGTPPLPGHSIAIVIAGGDDTAIATVIANGKLGCGTFGTESETVYDRNGVANVIFFSRPDLVNIAVKLTVTPLVGYLDTYGDLIAARMIAWVDSVEPGGRVNVYDMIAVSYLGPPAMGTYRIEPGNFTQNVVGHPPAQAVDIQMDWNQEPVLLPGNVSVIAPQINPQGRSP